MFELVALLGYSTSHPPVLLVPGLSGTGLLARIDDSAEFSGCRDYWPVERHQNYQVTSLAEGSDLFRLWLAFDNFRPPAKHQACFYKAMSLRYLKPTTLWQSIGEWEDPEGVEMMIDESFHGVEYLDYLGGYGVGMTRYYHDIIYLLETQLNYQRNHNLSAFGYDWRLPVWQIDWNKFRNRVEDLYKNSGNKAVIIISHSMGSLWLNYFLIVLASESWKREFIAGIISLNGANGGSFKAIRALTSGYSPLSISWFNYFKIPQLVSLPLVRKMCHTFPSLFSLTPNEALYGSELLVATLSGAKGQEFYTLRNWTNAILEDGLAEQISNVKLAMGDIGLIDPGVPYYCLFSYLHEPTTEYQYYYNNGSFDSDPEILFTWGDGTIPAASLAYCRDWNSTRLTHTFSGPDHLMILRDSKVLNAVAEILTSDIFHKTELHLKNR